MDFESMTWAMADGEYDGHVLFIRFREVPKTFPKSKYPSRLNVFWKMSEPNEHGLPTGNESVRLSAFEDRLVDAVEIDEHSIFVAALTCNGEREFVFYTTDVPEFMQRLTIMPQENERYPITIQTYDDPNWTYFQSMTAEN